MGWKYRDPVTNEWKNSVGSDGWIDITLSQSGLAADAKTTGEKITQTKNDANEYTDSKITEYIGDTKVADQINTAIKNINIPVKSVNDKTGAVKLTAFDVGALPSSTTIPSIDGLATEDYVDDKVAGIVNSAPETLDTLNELAKALGNDSNFAATIAGQIGTKVDKEEGKGLSTNDYTTADKNKLSGIAAGATKVVVDEKLDSTSTNPVQNKAIYTAIDNLDKLVGDKEVSIQIGEAIDECITGLSVSGKVITYTKGDGNTGTITTQDTNTTYSDATTSKSGLMSASDKNKLNGIEDGANKYTLPTASKDTLGGVKTTSNITSSSGHTACPIISGVPYYKTHPTSSGNKHIPSGGSSGQILRWSQDGTAKWDAESVPTSDSALSTTSTNPIQNKTVATAINDLSTLIGDEPVSTQISKIKAVPDCTQSDNGKFLCVVNGVAAWTAMVNGDEVSY